MNGNQIFLLLVKYQNVYHHLQYVNIQQSTLLSTLHPTHTTKIKAGSTRFSVCFPLWGFENTRHSSNTLSLTVVWILRALSPQKKAQVGEGKQSSKTKKDTKHLINYR